MRQYAALLLALDDVEVLAPHAVGQYAREGKPAAVCGACHKAGSTLPCGTRVQQPMLSIDANMKIKRRAEAGRVAGLAGSHLLPVRRRVAIASYTTACSASILHVAQS